MGVVTFNRNPGLEGITGVMKFFEANFGVMKFFGVIFRVMKFLGVICRVMKFFEPVYRVMKFFRAISKVKNIKFCCKNISLMASTFLLFFLFNIRKE